MLGLGSAGASVTAGCRLGGDGAPAGSCGCAGAWVWSSGGSATELGDGAAAELWWSSWEGATLR